mmetsp:Transcript_56374/g.164813  ORF Transcript_56374/g.164813 Transcript_56374/m.164813 type:complete len:83 (+) Transcript_56374:145-393(+)
MPLAVRWTSSATLRTRSTKSLHRAQSHEPGHVLGTSISDGDLDSRIGTEVTVCCWVILCLHALAVKNYCLRYTQATTQVNSG